MHWGGWPLPAGVPEPLQPPPLEGHTLFVPLAYMHQIGFAALESRTSAPNPDTLEMFGRFGEKIAVALDTARVFQEHLRTIEELHRLTEEQRQLQAMELELSAPLLPLLPGVLVLPLIGAIDSQRAERILEAELEMIIHEQAEVVLVEIREPQLIETAFRSPQLHLWELSDEEWRKVIPPKHLQPLMLWEASADGIFQIVPISLGRRKKAVSPLIQRQLAL